MSFLPYLLAFVTLLRYLYRVDLEAPSSSAILFFGTPRLTSSLIHLRSSSASFGLLPTCLP